MPANDQLGPGPGPIVLSPAGYVMRLADSASGNPVVTPVLAGSGLITAGTGDHPVTLAGTSGTLDLQFFAGAPGAARSVAYLVDNAATPTARLGISLDASNRPYAVLQNINGTLVGQSDPIGPALPAGSPLHVTLTWDSRHAFNGADFVLLAINGVIPNIWLYESKAPWVPFVPASLLVGYGNVGSFNGTIGLVQVTNAGNEFVSGTVTPPHLDVVPITANSSIAAPLKAQYKVAGTPVGASAVSGVLTQHIFTPADLGAAIFGWFRGDSGVTLDGSNKVSAMTDLGPSGYTATQSVAINRPGYAVNGGLGYLDYTGIEVLQALGSPGQAQPLEVFVVCRPGQLTPPTNGILVSGSTATLFQRAAGTAAMFAGAGLLADIALTTADHIVNAQYNGAGSVIAVDGDAGTAGNPGAVGLSAAFLIGNTALLNLGFIGRIYEVIIIIGLLSAQNRAAMNYYLKSRYTIA